MTELERFVLGNAFCPTGEGGGQDNSCSPKNETGEQRMARRQKMSDEAEAASGKAMKLKTPEAHAKAAEAHRKIVEDMKATGSAYGYGNRQYHQERLAFHFARSRGKSPEEARREMYRGLGPT